MYVKKREDVLGNRLQVIGISFFFFSPSLLSSLMAESKPEDMKDVVVIGKR
jgi:hypothetical protein